MPRLQGELFGYARPPGRFHNETSGRRQPSHGHGPSATLGSARPGSVKRARVDRFHVVKAMIVAAHLGVAAASAQDATNPVNNSAADLTAQLYECGSFYAVLKKCYRLDNTAQGSKASAVAADNLNKTIRLIYIHGTRAGVPAGDLLTNMNSSVENLMSSIGHRCGNVPSLLRKMGPSCATLIRNSPQQPGDKRKDFGDLDGYTPASVE